MARGIEKRRQRIPKKEIFTSLFILLGVGLVQNDGNGQVNDLEKLIIGIVPVVVAALPIP